MNIALTDKQVSTGGQRGSNHNEFYFTETLVLIPFISALVCIIRLFIHLVYQLL